MGIQYNLRGREAMLKLFQELAVETALRVPKPQPSTISLERGYFTFFSAIFSPSAMKKTCRSVRPSKMNSIWRSLPSS